MNVLRRIALSAVAGAVAGVVVAGGWGRLFMHILARLNPDAAGQRTDDGFEMGRFTLDGTVNLLFVALVLGVLGGLVFLALRGLRTGPTWFRWVSIVGGPTLVAGAGLVHGDGVDFRVLEPRWLAIVLALMMPLLYSIAVAWLGDRWLGTGPTLWDRLPTFVPWVARGALIVIAVAGTVSLAQTLIVLLDPNPFD